MAADGEILRPHAADHIHGPVAVSSEGYSRILAGQVFIWSILVIKSTLHLTSIFEIGTAFTEQKPVVIVRTYGVVIVPTYRVVIVPTYSCHYGEAS